MPLDAREIAKEIARLEYEESSYPNYAKLAHLYVIRDQMQHEEPPYMAERGYSYAPAATSDNMSPVDVDGTSEFLQAVNGKDSRAAWAIMDELMDTLRVVNERVYNRIMEKVNAL